MPTLVDTSDHPARDQADYRRYLITSAFAPLHVRPRRPGGSAARSSARRLGPVEAGDVGAPAHAVRRIARRIARDTRECRRLALVLRGSCVLWQNGRRTEAGVGNVVFYGSFLLRAPVENIAENVTENTVGGTAASDPRAGGGRAVEGSHARNLGGAVEPVTGAAGDRPGEPPAPSAESAEMLRAIQEWIEERLHDPVLSPAAIAAAHHISVRQLYRVFRPAGTTVARYVRARRLENCRRELGDPFLGARRIGAIAARWGLPDAAAFSRAFRAAYGQTPTAYRARATGPHRDV